MDIRANQLHQSYVAKARPTDQTYCGTPDGEMGPVERKLASMGEVKGLVVGAFGEVSADTHALISQAGGAGARSRGRSGQEESSCSAGAVVEETETGPCSLCTTRKRYSQKGPDPLLINVSYYVIGPYNHSALVQTLSSLV